MQLGLFRNIDKKELTEELFYAYYDCRKNKRNTINALAFEKHFEDGIYKLAEEIYQGTYHPGRSIAFIVNKPVKREIFAADFRDRIVHHWLINKLNTLFEQVFLPDSYACRVGKGTHYGIDRVSKFIQTCSENYTQNCYILKLDIRGFFMHIHRAILFEKLEAFIHDKYRLEDKALVLELAHKIIFSHPAKNCIIKGKKEDWSGLPKDKSLFYSADNCGLPIGNLTSQVFANFYMNEFDHFVKKTLKIKYYGRYVDDFILIHQDKNYLKSLIPTMTQYLSEYLKLKLHPNKIYLQHFTKGVKYLGTIILPHRIYIGNRTKGNFYAAIQQQNELIRTRKPDKEELTYFASLVNSYLGIFKHYRTYNIRKKLIKKEISAWWWNYFYVSNGMTKISPKVRVVNSRLNLLA